jgi:hypothetical protein
MTTKGERHTLSGPLNNSLDWDDTETSLLSMTEWSMIRTDKTLIEN